MRTAKAMTVFAAVATALSTVTLAGTPAGASPSTQDSAEFGLSHAVCGPPADGSARCYANVRNNADLVDRTKPHGLTPTEVKMAYGFPTSGGSGKTIAIVDAYSAPNIADDLAAFNTAFGVGSAALEIVDQNGGQNLPAADSGWALEIALDVEWAHAIAPQAKILLVEATSNSFSDLLTAERYAASHADYVSNSWGGRESRFESSYDSSFTSNRGVSFFVSSGDNGTPAEYPSSSPNVISVGGTTLNLTEAKDAFVSETGWSESGGGCSRFEAATDAQRNFAGYADAKCNGMRATPDVSLVGDPETGVSVYSSYYRDADGQSGWFVVGGTSASAPMWAARSAVEGAELALSGKTTVVDAEYVYGRDGTTFRDITAGNNGASALVGYDLVTGRGSWLGPNAVPLSSETGSNPDNAPPTAAFSVSCNQLSCTFTDRSSDSDGTVTGWAWTFGDGNSSTDQSPSHPYSTGGDYVVTLTVTDNDGATNSTSQTVSVSSTTKTHGNGGGKGSGKTHGKPTAV